MTAIRGRPRVHVAPCRFCQRTFKRHEHLKRHERIHTREKPFVCECGEGFPRQDMLVRHKRLTHPNETDSAQQTTPKSLEPLQKEDTNIIVGGASQQSGFFEDAPGESDSAFYPTVSRAMSHPESVAAGNLYSTEGTENHQFSNNGASINAEGDLAPLEDLAGMGTQAHEQLFSLFPTSNPSPDLDLFWNEPHQSQAFLPTDFFDTDVSIVDISQRFTDSRYDPSIVQAPVPLPEYASQPTIPSALPLELEPDESRPQPHMMSRLPSLEPVSETVPETEPSEHSERGSFVEEAPDSRRWKITPEMHRRIFEECEQQRDSPLSVDFRLPSRHALTRYLEGYLRRFHDHMPFLHIPTFSPSSARPEVILAFAAAGAMYKFEHTTGYQLYEVAQAIVTWRFSQTRKASLSRLTRFPPTYASMSASMDGSNAHSSPAHSSPQEEGACNKENAAKLSMLQAMLVLLALGSWGDRSLVPDALSMSSKIALLARELGISEQEKNTADNNMTWEAWAKSEEKRRALSVAYALTNLQSVAFSVPPAIMNHEIALNLPVSGPEWKASSASEWTRVRSLMALPTRPFQESLTALVRGQAATPYEGGPYSAFGIYLLIHGLLQQIFFARHGSGQMLQSEGLLSLDFVKKMERALRAWQASWEAMFESTLDPSSPKGPVGFNATALLRLAHIRLNVNIGPNCQFLTRDSRVIASASLDPDILMKSSSRHLDRAVLQSIQALSIPVRIGVGYVARTQTSNWSVQHALCNLECALLLIHWLQAMADLVDSFGLDGLYPDQVRLLNMTVSLVHETDQRHALRADSSHSKHIRRLAACIATVWAETFKGFHVFEMVHVIGTGITMVAERLTSQLK